MLTVRLLALVLVVGAVLLTVGGLLAAQDANDATTRARRFLAEYDMKVRPLEITAARAWWEANTTGKDEAFAAKEAAQNKLDAALADAARFAELKAIKAARDRGEIADKTLARAIDVLYLTFLAKQLDPDLLKQIVEKETAVEKAFNTYRAVVDGKEMTDSEVRKVLKSSTDSARRRAVWEASKGVGAVVIKELLELVRLRNQAAVKLGFKNFHAMQLFLNEQDGEELIRLFDQLDTLTREPFRQAKAEFDALLAKALNLQPDQLMPWHYHDPFFQEAPAVFAVSLDEPYARADIVQLCRLFYASIGLPVDRILERSDLFERPKKSPHAFCIDIDRAGDVRILANIVPNEYWVGTMLHELGHAVYSTHNNHIPDTLPYVLRGESHILTTEGVAMLFERFSKSRAWIEKMGLKVADAARFDEVAAKMQRNQLLVFSRWCQVMLRFEKAMYENPQQDLNRLWWDLVEQYQMVKRPADRNAPDFASKIHICTAPVYYHNYMMGQLFASQVHHTIAKEVFKADPATVIYNENKAVGDFLKRRIFEPGRTLDWRELTRRATGAELNASAFAADFKGQ